MKVVLPRVTFSLIAVVKRQQVRALMLDGSKGALRKGDLFRAARDRLRDEGREVRERGGAFEVDLPQDGPAPLPDGATLHAARFRLPEALRALPYTLEIGLPLAYDRAHPGIGAVFCAPDGTPLPVDPAGRLRTPGSAVAVLCGRAENEETYLLLARITVQRHARRPTMTIQPLYDSRDLTLPPAHAAYRPALAVAVQRAAGCLLVFAAGWTADSDAEEELMDALRTLPSHAGRPMTPPHANGDHAPAPDPAPEALPAPEDADTGAHESEAAPDAPDASPSLLEPAGSLPDPVPAGNPWADFGARVRRARRDAGLSQRELGILVGWDAFATHPQSVISQTEFGTRRLISEEIEALVHALDLPADSAAGLPVWTKEDRMATGGTPRSLRPAVAPSPHPVDTPPPPPLPPPASPPEKAPAMSPDTAMTRSIDPKEVRTAFNDFVPPRTSRDTLAGPEPPPDTPGVHACGPLGGLTRDEIVHLAGCLMAFRLDRA